ncbi:hypothetical protein ONZ43_g3152 [Nemania bipapillata]|uniref:Uncharacterized protein n=1 Tax=Nemania bipapillata TaxID=110536 RepID=A0ACC2IXS9_9PEZI|nr:hypothetical protein ONZ43_g3152 [Nemania bipapillata]
MSGERRLSSSLEAPERTGTEDPGAHELEASDSDEHYSDAQSAPGTSTGAASPIPRTRVEKVDDEPSYGEVPGTEAYEKRTEDASPDEIAIVQDVQSPTLGQIATSGNTPIPKTVVDETDDVPGSSAHNHHDHLHQADAAPDMIRKPDDSSKARPIPVSLDANTQDTDDTAVNQALKSPSIHRRRRSTAAKSIAGLPDEETNDDEDDDFGDDFDEFEEGDEDADFGEFDDGFQQAEAPANAQPLTSQPQVSIPSFGKEKPRSGSKKRKVSPQIPEFDLVAAKQLCATTEEALRGMTDIELQQHVKKLKGMEILASEVHEFWKKRTDEKIGDREAFEGVIENLVKHARKTRK